MGWEVDYRKGTESVFYNLPSKVLRFSDHFTLPNRAQDPMKLPLNSFHPKLAGPKPFLVLSLGKKCSLVTSRDIGDGTHCIGFGVRQTGPAVYEGLNAFIFQLSIINVSSNLVVSISQCI